MADTGPKIYDVSEYKPAGGSKHVHHGRTPAAWAGSTVALVAFIVGAVGLVIGNWTIFWVGAILLVASLVVTVILQKIGMGAV
jgi:Zn-dependent membrane protease YugP